MSITTDYSNNEAVFSFTSETAFTLPSYNSRNSISFVNLSSPALTLTAFGSELIDGNATYVVGGNSTAKLVRGTSGWIVVEGSDSSLTGVLTVSNATEATTAGAGSIVTAGGVYATKAIISGSATASTSITTGGIVGAGGLGITGAVYAGSYNTAGGGINYSVAAQGAGTAYSLTATAAKIDFGTTDPVIVLDKVGTYLIFGQVQLTYTGATVVAQTATVKLRRTNNTAADVSSVVVIDLPVSTTLTNTYGVVALPPILYTTAAATDSIEIFANLSATLGAGTIDATAEGTKIQAIRLY